ncbi:class I SAM-dependent methyltransferase [Proteus vulgaris]|uniref:class I SAM-dependent methyltransferase n=1 Tax=Proteus TaxID=583 RepID=UPI0018E4356B|nr:MULTISPECIES: class I SAM-dependent methyltransferase [Proteus]MBI6542030.1 class I SAM-dependent methyltransferase [Proteus vulgaris]
MESHYLTLNQEHWDKQAAMENQWSKPVSDEEIITAKQGNWKVHLTPNPVKKEWLADIKGKKILCLASAGGQQAPILAAAGGIVTVFDLSEGQLSKDHQLAQKHQLDLVTVQGDMADLTAFADESFDIIFHPISNLYVADVNPVWQECYRVLKKGGVLMASFYNPVVFIDDRDPQLRSQGLIRPTYRLPYSDQGSLPSDILQEKVARGDGLVFGHSLTDLIGGQLKAGFLLQDFVEDFAPHARFLVDSYIPTFLASKAIKL